MSIDKPFEEEKAKNQESEIAQEPIGEELEPLDPSARSDVAVLRRSGKAKLGYGNVLNDRPNFCAERVTNRVL